MQSLWHSISSSHCLYNHHPSSLSFSCSSTVLDPLSSAVSPPPIISKPSDTHTSVNIPIPKGIDKRGHPILYKGGRMVCNNFNDLDCSISSCRLLKACSFLAEPMQGTPAPTI
ncbi:hypothetical protein ATANTOWER_016532 [Ataeniobius toweri]|uniref:Uncharacterized protein n=1 Tax=Ataeniobius toweri TaxID=208326 RepID=A0ABU7ARF8_9TELE|nr:hypothetical protein [Ataeniobius toweri]